MRVLYPETMLFEYSYRQPLYFILPFEPGLTLNESSVWQLYDDNYNEI